MEAILVAAILDGAVLIEGLRVETGVLDGQGVVDNQLSRHHRVDLGRITTSLGDGIAQTGQVHQCGLAENVMAHHPGGVPGEVQIALAVDQLFQRGGEFLRLAAAHQLLGQYPGGIWQFGPGAGLDGIHGGGGVVIVQVGAWQVFTVLGVHACACVWLRVAHPLPSPLPSREREQSVQQGSSGALAQAPLPLRERGWGEGEAFKTYLRSFNATNCRSSGPT